MILHGRLLIDPDLPPEPGWVRLDGAAITEMGRGAPPHPADAGAEDALICPGFSDAHMHVPQIDSVGCESNDLLRWLDEVIFPAEARWADPAHAAAQCRAALRRMLRAGTTGFAGFLTAHATGLDAFRAAHDETPLRAVVGQVLMDRAAPRALTTQDIADLPRDTPRLRHSINPRFAISCTPALLADAARRAGTRSGTIVHTHLAEQATECTEVRSLFPGAASYTAIYDDAGLLGPRTLLAHAVHLDDDEWRLIAARDVTVVHCPGANTFLSSGLFDIAAARRHGVRMALGSDVAAGPDLAMPRVARAMIEVAKLRRLTVDPAAVVPSPAEAWRLITEGNAGALGHHDAGRLEVGAAADLLILRPDVPRDAHLVGRLLYGWRDDWITDRILAGRRVDPIAPAADAAPRP